MQRKRKLGIHIISNSFILITQQGLKLWIGHIYRRGYG